MEYGYEILSRGFVFWMALKDHLSYFVTINQQYYIPTTIGVQQIENL